MTEGVFKDYHNKLESCYKTWFDKFKNENKKNKKIIFVSDCDGILSDGKNVYNEIHKIFKNYGQYDKEAIKYICDYAYDILIFVTGDKKGFKITQKRINDISSSCNNRDHIQIYNYNSEERLNLLKDLLKNNRDSYIVFIGDSLSDIPSLSFADYSLTVNNAPNEVRFYCDYISPLKGSEGGFADCIFAFYKYISKKYNE